MVTKSFSILISGLIFIQSVNINLMDLSKLQIMIDHLDYHQDSFDESFGDFVSIHYGSDKILHSDDHEHDDEHKNLPFKKKIHVYENIPIVYILSNSAVEFVNNNSIELSANFFYKEMHSQFEKPDVFQPPKQA